MKTTSKFKLDAETLKEYIVSFRISKEQPIIGVKSVSQWFRKVGCDYITGRVTYKNPEDIRADFDI
jgi:hypothetical protein